MLWDVSTGRGKTEEWSVDLNFSFQRNKVNTEENRDRRMDGGGHVCWGGGGYSLHILKKPKAQKKKKKSSRVEGLLYIHIYEYIDNTADKGVCKSIYFHYIDSYDGRKDFLVCRLSRKGDLLVLVTNTSGALLRADPSKTWRQTEASLPQLFRSTEMDKLNTHTSEGSM